MAEKTQWWLTALGDTLVWARLREREAGTAEVLDCDGQVLVYECLDSARAALMDAEFRQYDGLDAEDALALGWKIDAIRPPEAESDAALRRLMAQKRPD